MSIGIIDTCIFCNILKIPGMHQRYDEVMHQLRDFINQGYILLLPMATIIETGNHIAQNGDGNQRREIANKYVEVVNKAIEGNAPWVIPSPLFDQNNLTIYLQEFPDNAMRGVGLGDLSIIKEFYNQCELNSTRRIFIWSLDTHLSTYEKPAPRWVE
jgi:hypothetical protein